VTVRAVHGESRARHSGNASPPRAKAKVAIAGLLAAILFMGSAVVSNHAAQAATPSFVQGAANEVGSGTTNAVPFAQNNTAGNLIAVYVLWNNSGAATLADSRGNAYAVGAARTAWGNGWSSQTFYAKNIAGGANTVTATFATSISSFAIVYIQEYAGLDKVNPLDVSASATGSTSAMSSGAVTTTSANDLLFGGGASINHVTAPGAGFTARSKAFGNLTEDRTVTSTGSYAATATQNSNAWVMQLVAFRADSGSQPPPDTVPPTVPTGLTATAVSGSQVNLAWTASMDNVGVTGYTVYRNGSILTTSPSTTFQDTTAQPSTSYSYTVDAFDAAGLHSSQSVPAPATTPAGGTTTPGLQAAYAFDEGTGASAIDASQHGLTGTLQNGASWAPGKFGAAVQLGGSNEVVDLGNPASLQMTGSMTVSAWIFSTSFPGDDAAIVSKRGSTGYQLDTTADTGLRTIGFKLTNSSGANMMRYGKTALTLNSWYFVTGVYDASAATMHVYLNGVLDDGGLVGTVTGTQQNSPDNVKIGQRSGSGGFGFPGRIDNTRIYSTAQSLAQLQADMNAPLGTGGATDPQPPTVGITAPANNAVVNDIVTITASATDNVGVSGVQFQIDNVDVGVEDAQSPYTFQWDTRATANGPHTLGARGRDAAGNVGTAAPVAVNVANINSFQNDILATGFDLPTAMTFLPDGRLLLGQLQGAIKVLSAPYTQASPTLFNQITNIGSAGVQQGIFDIKLDPNFTTNHFYYVFYTAGTPNRDRLSRFTANAALTGTIAGSELVLYQDGEDANSEHHGGAVMFGNDGKIYFTTGEHFNAPDAQSLNNPRGKIHRINPDGTVPTDNPFFDGSGPHVDSIWAYGLRNPYRAFYDAPTGRMFVGDVGGNVSATAEEEIDIGARGANYGWPNFEGDCPSPCTSPLYAYDHTGDGSRHDAAVTGGFVYHGAGQPGFFPAAYEGSYFFGDYAQHWIKRLTVDTSGNLTGAFNFEPANGVPFGPYGDIVYLTEGPDGSLYYLDLGYSDNSGTFGVSKLRRIRYVSGNQPPTAVAGADRTSGPAPLTVNFSSAGSVDPEGQALTYSWTFGDNTTSTAANPQHTYSTAGQYSVRLTVSDGVNQTPSAPLTIVVGSPPTATILSPTDGIFFKAGDVINYSGDGTGSNGVPLPASAFTWNIDFLHLDHVHPGTPITGVKSGSFTIPTSGHDFSGLTRYRITLTVTDSSGLTSTKSVTIWPTKVNLTFNTVPSGLTFYLDGIAHQTPFVYDDLVGFNHSIDARNQTIGSTAYTFTSWSDGGAQVHNIVTPNADASYTATYGLQTSVPPAFVQGGSRETRSGTTCSATFSQVNTAGNLIVAFVIWNNNGAATVSDSNGNTYAAATARTAWGSGWSAQTFYAKNIKAGANTVTATFGTAISSFGIVYIHEYSGLDPANPLDVASSAVGTTAAMSSGSVATTHANDLLFGAGASANSVTAVGAGYTARSQDFDNLTEDRNVTATGSYAATATQNANAWVMQLVAFKAAT
jgi:glucose/arabinose dehydrogenase/PKD repeat protein